MTKEKRDGLEASPDELALVTAYLAAEEKRHAERAKHSYDGVLGRLPTWFPQLARDEFTRLRNKILDLKKIQPAQVKTWIEAYISIADEGLIPPWPDHLTEEVGRLSQLYAAFKMGQAKGLRFLLGDDHAKALTHGQQVQTGRRNAGKITGKKKQEQGERTEKQVRDAEDELRSAGIRKGLNKLIAKRLTLSVDHVRRLRKKRT